MIGLSVSDIIKLLEQVPGWKAVAGLPKRLAELEARVKALESGAGRPSQAPGPRDCAKCGAVMRVTDERSDQTFGRHGVVVHVMACDNCGHTTERKYSARQGYL